MGIKDWFVRMENKWWFWIIFIVFLIGVWLTISGDGIAFFQPEFWAVFPIVFIFLPIGLLYYFEMFGVVVGQIGTIIVYPLWIGSVTFLIYKIVKDKKFNWKLILILLLILVMSMYGCEQMIGDL